MQLTRAVKKILSHYPSDNPGVKTNLARILMQGRLKGKGRLLILPVDQGFEHGPNHSFLSNPEALDPLYFFKLAIDTGLSAFAAPLGLLEAGADPFAGTIPLILKMNSGSRFVSSADDNYNQAVTGSVKDALRLGCIGVGFTIYPGSDKTYEMMEEAREVIREAKDAGLMTVLWSYPRGNMSKAGETGLDTISYAAHMAALMGAHIIKVKLPTDHIENPEAGKMYQKYKIPKTSLKDRVAHVMKCCFDGKRMVVFSGGGAQDTDTLLKEAQAIRDGGGYGSIMGRNSFQRPQAEAHAMLKSLMKVYSSS